MKGRLSLSAVRAFRKTVYEHYETDGRDLPWRRRVTPYRVFVSEVMLQQTQVSRVAVKFPLFVRRFPSWKRLAFAPLREVLVEWQGMGYNRRGRWLHESAKSIVSQYGGRLPRDPAVLATLPGVGFATAASIGAFAFNLPTVFIETNVRAVFIHHFFEDHESVDDRDILPLVVETMDADNPRRWYSALMDYGTALKAAHNNPARRSLHWKRQGAFVGSIRYMRGKVLAFLLKEASPATMQKIVSATGLPGEGVRSALESMCRDGLARKRENRFTVC